MLIARPCLAPPNAGPRFDPAPPSEEKLQVVSYGAEPDVSKSTEVPKKDDAQGREGPKRELFPPYLRRWTPFALIVIAVLVFFDVGFGPRDLISRKFLIVLLVLFLAAPVWDYLVLRLISRRRSTSGRNDRSTKE